jgi:RNA polymerase sigma-70 factor (ECF subfamily)
MSSTLRSTPASTPREIFATTHWTVVLAAGQRHTAQADRALEELCRGYWFPLYAYVRRRGYSKEDAEDLTQAFFARFLEKNYLAGLDAERGRFRAFLLASLKHFLINDWKKSQRVKRGGGETILSLDWQSADTQFQVASTAEPSPDKAFDREWALALLGKVIAGLQAECEGEGRRSQFAELKIFLTAGKGAVSYAEVALRLDLDEAAVRVLVHRLRKRYRELLRAEIANTLADPAKVNEELRALFGAFE